MITRGPRTNTFYENNDTVQMQTSPSAIVEDTGTSPLQDLNSRFKALQTQPSRP